MFKEIAVLCAVFLLASCGRSLKDENEEKSIIEEIRQDIAEALITSTPEVLSKDIEAKKILPMARHPTVKKRRGTIFFPPPANLGVSSDTDSPSLEENKLSGFMSAFIRPASLEAPCGDSPIYFLDQKDGSDCYLNKDNELGAVKKLEKKSLLNEAKPNPVIEEIVKPEIEKTPLVIKIASDLANGIYVPEHPDAPENLAE